MIQLTEKQASGANDEHVADGVNSNADNDTITNRLWKGTDNHPLEYVLFDTQSDNTGCIPATSWQHSEQRVLLRT